jgi:type VI secretion system protein
VSLAAAFAACSHAHVHRRVKGEYTAFVRIDSRINSNGAVPVDLILVYDKPLIEKLQALPAAEWFARRAQFRRDNQEGKKFDLWGWEWVPGQTVAPIRLPRRHGALAAIVYANYQEPGDHRWRVDPNRNLRIDLEESEVIVTPVE